MHRADAAAAYAQLWESHFEGQVSSFTFPVFKDRNCSAIAVFGRYHGTEDADQTEAKLAVYMLGLREMPHLGKFVKRWLNPTWQFTAGFVDETRKDRPDDSYAIVSFNISTNLPGHKFLGGFIRPRVQGEFNHRWPNHWGKAIFIGAAFQYGAEMEVKNAKRCILP